MIIFSMDLAVSNIKRLFLQSYTNALQHFRCYLKQISLSSLLNQMAQICKTVKHCHKRQRGKKRKTEELTSPSCSDGLWCFVAQWRCAVIAVFISLVDPVKKCGALSQRNRCQQIQTCSSGSVPVQVVPPLSKKIAAAILEPLQILNKWSSLWWSGDDGTQTRKLLGPLQNLLDGAVDVNTALEDMYCKNLAGADNSKTC